MMQFASAILAFVGGLLMASNLFGTSRLVEFERRALSELRSLSFGDIFKSKISLRIWRTLSGLLFFDFNKGMGRGSDYVVADPSSLRAKWENFRKKGGILVDIGIDDENWGEDFHDDAIQVSAFYYYHPDREEVFSEGFSYSFASGFVHKIQVLPPHLFGFDVIQDEEVFEREFTPTSPKRFFIYVAPFVKIPLIGTVRIPNNPLFSTLIDQNIRRAIEFSEDARKSIMRMHLNTKHQSNVKSGFLSKLEAKGEDMSGKKSAVFLFDEFPHPHDQGARPDASLSKAVFTTAYVAGMTLAKSMMPIIAIVPAAIALIFVTLFELYYLIVALIFNFINLLALAVCGALYLAILLPTEFFARIAARLTIESYTRLTGLFLIAVAFVLSFTAP